MLQHYGNQSREFEIASHVGPEDHRGWSIDLPTKTRSERTGTALEHALWEGVGFVPHPQVASWASGRPFLNPLTRPVPPRGVLLKKHLELLRDRLPDQLARPAAQQLRERIDNFIFLAKPNYRILMHGGVTPGWLLKSDIDTRIPAGHAAFLNSPPYTRFGYSSIISVRGQLGQSYLQEFRFWPNHDDSGFHKRVPRRNVAHGGRMGKPNLQEPGQSPGLL